MRLTFASSAGRDSLIFPLPHPCIFISLANICGLSPSYWWREREIIFSNIGAISSSFSLPFSLSLSVSVSPCSMFCGSILAFKGYRCMWCHRVVHEKCYENAEKDAEICDLGPFREMILPPTAVVMTPLPEPKPQRPHATR